MSCHGRPRQSAARYAGIWTPEGSPLSTWTVIQAKRLAGEIACREAKKPHLQVVLTIADKSEPLAKLRKSTPST